MSISGARWRLVTGATLAVFFMLAGQAVPAHAGPAWKDAVAEIESLRDEAIRDLFDLVGVYEAYLAEQPTADEAAEELANIHTEMEGVAGEAIAEIVSVIDDYPESPQVQNAGSQAISLVTETGAFVKDLAAYRYNEYVEGSTPPTTTTTTTVPATTTTVPVTTTTFPSTTTTVPATTTTIPATTTTLPDTTTTVPATTTTTATTTVPTTTTTTVAATVADGSASANPPAAPAPEGIPADELAPSTGFAGGESLGPGGGPAPLLDKADPLSVVLPDQEGITASLTRVLEPVLPVKVAEVVVSPLLILELLWRAISSSGRGLVMPVSLLVFTLISLLWDRRLKQVSTAS